jgi:adenine-specific DNA-methyltransferase
MNLHLFNTTNLFEAATNLFQQLNIKLNSNTAEPLPIKDILKHHYKDNDTFNAIDKTFFIGIIDDSVFKATGMFNINYSYKEAIEQGDKNYNGLMLFALELKKQPTRTEISELTRTFNRISQKMPVALVLKYTVAEEAVFSIAISERFKYLQNWRQGEKAGKVIILRDIHTQNTHAGHTRILQDLVKPVGVSTYEQLHQHWLQVLDVSILNKRFFQDLSNWYFSAMNEVSFPDDLEKKMEVRNATNLIRLITRVIFIWFIKEKQLVPASLFRKDFVASILKDFNQNKKSQNYYNAILQNLFFGTLNQKMEERKFAKEGDIKTNKEEYGVKTLFRYADLFNIPEKEVLALFKDVPFLNGGLFDCLDKPNDDGKIEYVDGFSRNAKKQASVPDYIFFGEEKEVDLNEVYGTKNKRYSSRGLINLLESYKFTVAENTPIEEEIALDPELLGKVFENLLASYNPETQTTARKQTGSFYTPREIVNYMVDESLLEYIKQNVKNENKDFETRLRDVFSYSENPNPFCETETKDLIEAINNCKILDPACGSGAFPMGILHKMVHILKKLDPENKLWKDLQRKKAIEETEAAFNIGDKEERAKRLAEINDVFENNASDYGRKLYLIENCIYGIDIQPIAVQIAKLRFFISLVIDQKVNKTKKNFGVRSLPNLETKFVAANTLIGLDKPQQTLLRNPDIEVKETELKELRHKYFTANTRKEKIALQKQDKKLRLEIAKMLENDGWETKVAKQIVAFDPYDQNTFANWFETEWMFGSDLVNGFDIIIGNPPWGAKLTAEEKLLFKTSYPKIDSSTPNSFAYFIGWAYKNYKNVISYVLPDSILIKDFAKTRSLIKNKIDEIIWYENTGIPEEHRPFVYVDHDVCVINIFNNDKKDLEYTLVRFNKDLGLLQELDFIKHKDEIILEEFEFAFNLIAQEKDFKILNKLSKFQKLESFMQCHEGIHTGNSRELLFVDRKKNKYCKPLFYGGGAGDTIQNYVSKTSGWYVDYRSEIVDKEQGYYASLRDERIFKLPKIYITRTGNPFKAFYDFDTYASNNFFSLQHVDYTKNKEEILKSILPFIISKLAQYFIRTFAAPRLGSTFIETKIFHLLKFRVPEFSKSNLNDILKMVNQIIEEKENDVDANTSKTEIKLEKYIYSLYDLTDEEIKIIEGNE